MVRMSGRWTLREPPALKDQIMPALTAEALRQRLTTRRFGRPLHVHEQVASTNDLARALGEQGAPEGATVIAASQTGGRGRRGRSWWSPPGGLWMSVIVRPALAVERWPLVGMAAAAAAAAAVAGTGVPVRVKWPNDLVVGGRKLGGVLVEAAAAYAVVGIGINANVSAAHRPQEVPAATSLAELLDREVDLASLACGVLREFEDLYEVLERDSPAVLAAWRRRAALLGRQVRVTGAQELEGTAVDVDEHGALLVSTASGVRRVVAGDVTLRAVEVPHG